MKQILQDLSNGDTRLAEVPVPVVGPQELLIQSSLSMVSTGTERMLVEFGKAGILEKARQQPDKVKMVFDKMKSEGIMSTVEAVKSRLEQHVPLGYSNVGVVQQVGESVDGFAPGDRVVSNGPHAEFVSVGQNLCARIPDDVTDEQAVFSVAGAIGLQGIRLADPQIGECFVVTGLGLIGLLTVQILKANGCRVVGIDIEPSKLELARSFGAEVVDAASNSNVVERVMEYSRGRGADGVLITASSDSDDIVHQAAQMCRKRGRIVLVGVVGLKLRRADFYEKEISFQVSCSYGPGRYDSAYEEMGRDYPIGFVRWTEQRNFEAILDMLSAKSINVESLISAQHRIDDVTKAYDQIRESRSVLGVLLRYEDRQEQRSEPERTVVVDASKDGTHRVGSAIAGVIGGGNYASRVLIPGLAKSGAGFRVIVTSRGVSGERIARKFGFSKNSTDPEEIFADQEINAVVIATRHNSHADYVVRALDSGKNVFVEKPLALTIEELEQIEAAQMRKNDRGEQSFVMVGFNRRYSPYMTALRSAVRRRNEPICLVYTCNAGQIGADSWVNDKAIGGGRILGEAVHFIDAARFLSGSPIVNVSAVPLGQAPSASGLVDSASITVTFESGSIAVINYFANGHRAYSKERLEVYQGGNVAIMDNFRSLRSFGEWSLRSRSFRPDRGQQQCAQAFVDAVAGKCKPIPIEEILEVSRAAIDAANQVSTNPEK